MLKNFFKTAWRNLWNNKFYSAINIAGLAVGLATGIMLLLWVQNEISYDKFHSRHKNIYQLSTHFNMNGEPVTWTGVPGPLAVQSKKIPQVETIVRINRDYDQILSTADKSKMFDGNNTAAVDSGFFKIFDFDFVNGNAANAFPNLNTTVLTVSTAKKLFGDENPIGKSITYYKNIFTVTGVLQDFPENSSLQFDALFPMSFYANLFTEWGGNGDWKTIDEDLGNYAFDTYVYLKRGANPKKVGAAFTQVYSDVRNGNSDATFELQKLDDIHLVGADGNITALSMVQIFLLVVVLILVIASINYVNLSTARALARAKEVSIRKIIGAERRQLFLQFTLETLMLFFFALCLAVLIIYLLMPVYNNISGKQLAFSLGNAAIWKALGLATLGTLVLSSIYPALLLSSFNPMAAIQGKVSTNLASIALRKGLVVFQFVISIVLLISTIIMSNQMEFMRKKNLGFDKNYVFSVPLTEEAKSHAAAIKTELNSHPEIAGTGVSDAYNITSMHSSTGDIDWPGKPKDLNMIISQMYADVSFLPTMKINFVEGENFTGTPADSSYFILNESAVNKIGLKKPYVGQQVSFHDRKGTIRGVVKDFNFQSLKEKIAPLLIYSAPWNGNILYVRTKAASAQKAIKLVEAQYKQYAGDVPFKYTFVDKAFDELYKTEDRAGSLFNVFAGIAIFISCLGLFGLATYTAQVKTKEIGIRKVLGATVPGIVGLISKDFLKLVLIALIVSVPIGWWVMNKWLDGFAYRTNISWWIFLVAGAAAIAIAFATISIQAIKAANANPVRSLRNE